MLFSYPKEGFRKLDDGQREAGGWRGKNMDFYNAIKMNYLVSVV